MKHRVKVTVTGYYEVEADLAKQNYEGATTAAEVAAIDQRAYDENHVAAAEVIEWCDDEVTVVVEAAPEGGFREEIAVTIIDTDGEAWYDSTGEQTHIAEDHEYGHDHLHGDGPGQHKHDDWTPDKVLARMKRDGFCGHQDGGGVCMTLASVCTDHPQPLCGREGCTERLTHIHPTL